LKVTGDLTIHGTTKEVVLDVDGLPRRSRIRWGRTACAWAPPPPPKLTAMISESAGLPGMIGDDITITLDVEMVKK
jgi:hypothetical protein